MPRLPSGTVTFLFTDVEGSTRLLHELGDAYAEVLAEHRRVLREAFARHGGVEVDTQGDAFFVAFARAGEAFAAAREARDALADGRVRVRIGLHTGEPLLTDEGYVGIDVHRAARIAAAGHGGQILLSQATRDLVGEDDLRDLGEHRLKDLAAPERIYQLGDEQFPPLETLHETNLPVQPTPLVGRKRELADVLRAIQSERARLLTLTGPGGIGKTRLALQAAAELAGRFSGGVWFVDLSALRDPDLIESTVAATLGAKRDLREDIGDRELLLVLDNFEQVAEGAAGIAGLLATCPRLAILVTSREALHVRAEREYPLRPLAEAPAVELFRERAGAVAPEFEAEYHELAQICNRLDDLPLAIELAAARVKMLRPAALLERLEQRLPLLTGGARDAPERQRTLAATIAWSYELLGDEERRLFGRLAVFAGGWLLAGAHHVCEAELDTLQSLVDKSLVRRDDDRYAMLETIREYALERLEESGEADGLRRLHADYFVAFAERAEPELTGPEQPVWLARLAVEYENLRQAFRGSIDRGRRDLALRIAAALVFFWYIRGLHREGLDWLGSVLHSDDGASPAGRTALWGAGVLAVLAGDHMRGGDLLEQHLRRAREAGDRSGEARALNVLGLLAFFANDLARARRLFEESVELAREAGDSWCLADALGTLSSVYPLQGELDAAFKAGEEALEIARNRTDQQGVRMALFGLALAALRSGDPRSADALAAEGLAVCREIGDLWFISYFLWILADATAEHGELDGARVYADESVAVAREVQAPLLLACALEVRARVALDRGDREQARRDLEEAHEATTREGVPKSYVSAVLFGLGRLLDEDGDREGARRALSQALSVAEEIGDTWAAARAGSALALLD